MAVLDDLKGRVSAPFRRFVDEPFDSALQALAQNADSGNRVPSTSARSTYGLTIHARNGKKRGVIGQADLAPAVGGVFNASSQQSIQVDEEYTVRLGAYGLPDEMVLQIQNGRDLTLARYELYSGTIEQVFTGRSALLTLADQTFPFSIRMQWKGPPTGTVSAILGASANRRVYEFQGCIFTSLGKTQTLDDRVVGESATVRWQSLVQLA